MSSDSCEAAIKKLIEYLDSVELVRLFRSGQLDVDGVLKRISELEDGDPLLHVKPDGSSMLAQFSVLGSYEIVEKLWQRDLRPFVNTKGNCTLLHCAVHVFPCDSPIKHDLDRSKILRLFFSAGEDYANCLPVNQQNDWGWTPLKIAVRQKLEKCIEVLLEHGADTMVSDEQGYSPLHNALGNHVIVKLLLKANSRNINSQNSEGDTALSLSLKKGDLESCMVLLEHEADPNISNKDGITPLFLAAKMGHLELVKALVKHGSVVNAQGGEQGLTPLHWAAHTEMEEVALYLIERGGDVTAGDKEGRTPLSMAAPELAEKMRAAARRHTPSLCTRSHSCTMTAQQKAVEACCSGNITALTTLLHAGVSINYASGDTQASLVHIAACYGQLKVLMHLYHHGANIHAVDRDGDTVLHFACMKTFHHGMHIPMIKMLAGGGLLPNPNIQNHAGDTPLMTAIKHGCIDRALFLLNLKVDTKIPNLEGELPIHRAAQDIKSIELLFHVVECCSDINIRDKKGFTPLMYAVATNCSSAVKYLLQRGAESNVVDNKGNTPLIIAAQENNLPICHSLMMAGANPSGPATEKKITPLHIAVQRNNLILCKILLMFGANLMAKDVDGNTPVSLATPELKKAMQLGQNLKNELLQQLHSNSGTGTNSNGEAPDNESTCNGCTETTPTVTQATPTCMENVGLADRSAQSSSCGGQRSTRELGQGSNDKQLPVYNGEVRSEEAEPKSGGVVTKKHLKAKSLEKQAKEGSVEEEEELSCERLLDMKADLTSTIAQLQQDLDELTQNNQLLLGKNKSLEEEMKRNEHRVVSRHMHQALSLSVHALCHNLMYTEPQKVRSRHSVPSRSNSDGVNKLPPHFPSFEESDGSSQSIEEEGVVKISDPSSDDAFHNKAIFPKYNPMQSGYLQWWMVDRTTVECEDTALNSSSPAQSKFFDVYRGTFRHMKVVERTIRNLHTWKYEQYMSFFREVNFLSCLHSPHIVQFLGACFDPASKSCSIINEYMSRGSLHSILHEEELPLEWKTRTSIMQDVAHGMAFLHSHQVLHCNLTPRNILIGEHFNAKLNDFDFYETKLKCGFIDELKSNTPEGYVAPEARENFEFTQATDVYSFGVVMYECGTGKTLFADLQCNPVALVMRLVMGGFPEGVAPGYKTLAVKCWDPDPAQRPHFESILAEVDDIAVIA